MLDKISKIGWRAAELALLTVVLCVLLYLILGDMSGSYVHSVAINVIQFSQDVPPGTLLGFALITFLYWFLKNQRRG